MNAVERLEAAIAKLEALKDGSSPGEWVLEGEYLHALENVYTFGSRPVGRLEYPDDDALVLTLHRTIDAQLAILREALSYARNTIWLGPVIRLGLTLADAILGGAS